MKQITLLLLSLFSFQFLSAQITWFQPDDRWTFHVASGWVGAGIEQIHFEKDTVIGGLTYKKMLRSQHFTIGAESTSFRMLRQDGQKIYVLNENSVNGQEEMLLYDFALQVGDTLRLTGYGVQPFGYVITGRSTISIGGQDRVKQAIKWIELPSHAVVQKGTFIEGLGCVEGTHVVAGEDCISNSYLFLDEPAGIIADGTERIFCSFQSGTAMFEVPGNILCKTLPTHDPLENPVFIYPIPSTGALHFSPLFHGSEYQVTLYDLAGKQLAQTTLTGDDSINTIFKGTAVVVVQSGEYRMVQRVVFF